MNLSPETRLAVHVAARINRAAGTWLVHVEGLCLHALPPTVEPPRADGDADER